MRQAAVGAEGARPLLDGAVGRAGDRLAVHRVRPGQHVRLARVAPVRVLALLGVLVVPLDGRLERVRVDADLARPARGSSPASWSQSGACWPSGPVRLIAMPGLEPDDALLEDVGAEDDPGRGLVGVARGCAGRRSRTGAEKSL